MRTKLSAGSTVLGALVFLVLSPGNQASSAPANGLEIVDLRIDSLTLGVPASVEFGVTALRSVDSVTASIGDLKH